MEAGWFLDFEVVAWKQFNKLQWQVFAVQRFVNLGNKHTLQIYGLLVCLSWQASQFPCWRLFCSFKTTTKLQLFVNESRWLVPMDPVPFSISCTSDGSLIQIYLGIFKETSGTGSTKHALSMALLTLSTCHLRLMFISRTSNTFTVSYARLRWRWRNWTLEAHAQMETRKQIRRLVFCDMTLATVQPYWERVYEHIRGSWLRACGWGPAPSL